MQQFYIPLLILCAFTPGMYHIHRTTETNKPAVTSNPTPIVVQMHNNNDNANAAQGGNASPQTTLYATLEQKMNNLQETCTIWYNNACDKASWFHNELYEKRYHLGAGCMATGYCYLSYQCYKAKNLIKHRSSWCNWKQTIDIQHLVSTPYQEVIPQLLTDIQKKYLLHTCHDTHTKLKTAPFEQFIKDIYTELALLKKYQLILSWSNKLHLSFLFSLCYNYDIIQEKINRLHLLLDIFITWQTQDLLK